MSPLSVLEAPPEVVEEAEAVPHLPPSVMLKLPDWPRSDVEDETLRAKLS